MKKFFIILGVLVVVAAVVFIIVGGKKLKLTTTVQNTPATPPAPVSVTPPSATPPAHLAEMTEAQTIKILVKKFTEVYGSYSTDDHFANLESLKPVMTDTMIVIVDKIIADGQQSKDFFGVTTRMISAATEQQNGTQVVVRAKTQRQETKAGAAPRIFYQDLVLTLVKNGNNWLVDQAKWQ